MPLARRSPRSITGWCCVRSQRPAGISCSAPRTVWANSACGVGLYFLLGAAHSLGNLGLRIGLLDPLAGPAIQAARPKADFAPGSDDKRAWLSLSVSSEILAKAASGSANVPLARISTAVSGLAVD